MKIIIVCGGRKYDNWNKLNSVLNRLLNRYPHLLVIQGGATGADRLAFRWCRENGVAGAQVLAPWQHDGKAAGAIRNSWMLGLRPSLVVAFPGGTGTADMCRQAKEANVAVQVIKS